jgi:hypothetical protein
MYNNLINKGTSVQCRSEVLWVSPWISTSIVHKSPVKSESLHVHININMVAWTNLDVVLIMVYAYMYVYILVGSLWKINM